ncbi:MAG: hypothetical protein Q4G25_09990 [Paracoccus sp. (in: a-proteobacteria)]|nr:hypothetical protein [Paracoccus sp. (in: a-proteobacteria)]
MPLIGPRLTLIATLAMAGAALAPVGLLGEPTHDSTQKISVGDALPKGSVHIVSEPGRYGLGPVLPGSLYAVFDNKLIRIDATTHKVQSVIRRVDQIVD